MVKKDIDSFQRDKQKLFSDLAIIITKANEIIKRQEDLTKDIGDWESKSEEKFSKSRTKNKEYLEGLVTKIIGSMDYSEGKALAIKDAVDRIRRKVEEM